MQRIVTNLLENAIKYTQESGRVWISADLLDDSVRIVVKDNGIGISHSDLPRIFERVLPLRSQPLPKRCRPGTEPGPGIRLRHERGHSCRER